MGIFCKSAAVLAPTLAISISADFVASAREKPARFAPLCMMALWNSPLAEGMASKVLTFAPPPD